MAGMQDANRILDFVNKLPRLKDDNLVVYDVEEARRVLSTFKFKYAVAATAALAYPCPRATITPYLDAGCASMDHSPAKFMLLLGALGRFVLAARATHSHSHHLRLLHEAAVFAAAAGPSARGADTNPDGLVMHIVVHALTPSGCGSKSKSKSKSKPTSNTGTKKNHVHATHDDQLNEEEDEEDDDSSTMTSSTATTDTENDKGATCAMTGSKTGSNAAPRVPIVAKYIDALEAYWTESVLWRHDDTRDMCVLLLAHFAARSAPEVLERAYSVLESICPLHTAHHPWYLSVAQDAALAGPDVFDTLQVHEKQHGRSVFKQPCLPPQQLDVPQTVLDALSDAWM